MSQILLGNLSIGQIEKRLGIRFPDNLMEYMSDKHQDNAGKLSPNTWHCFDIPFVLVCENMAMAQIIFDYLKPFQSEMTGQLQISLQSKE